MASYTGLSNLKNRPHRSGFDISRKVLFTAKAGEFLPVWWDIGLPGDKYSFLISYFTRTQPVQTSAYTRIREYFDVYEVPLSLLWKSAPTAITQMGEKNPVESLQFGKPLTVSTGLPSMPLKDIAISLVRMNGTFNTNPDSADGTLYGVNNFGFSRGSCAYKLLSYLGYGPVRPQDGSDDPNGYMKGGQWGTSLDLSQSSETFTDMYAQNLFVNVFPILAYQKIYQDHIRWDQWENADPSTYNVDFYDGTPATPFYGTLPADEDEYWQNPNMFDLRYVNFNKDLFMGVLPETQFGDVAVVTTDGAPNGLQALFSATVGQGAIQSAVVAELPGTQGSAAVEVGSGSPSTNWTIRSVNSSVDLVEGGSLKTINQQTTIPVSVVNVDRLQTQFSILQLRQQNAVQRWKEISQSGSFDYKEQIYKHWGIRVPDSLSNLSTYLGGIARNLDISEVVNTALDTEGSEPTIHGKGVGSGSGSINFTVKEHSVVMVCYHAVPLMDYSLLGVDPQLMATDATDLPIPEMDNIGMESVSLLNFFNTSTLGFGMSDSTTSPLLMGYQPRYYAWKSKVDVIRGAFQTTLIDWTAPFTVGYLIQMLRFHTFQSSGTLASTPFAQSWNYNVFKVNPHILDSIFGVAVDSTWDTDQLLVNCEIGAKVVRSLSRDGLPY